MIENKNGILAIKLGLLGDSTVGKTCICEAYLNYEFIQDKIATIGADKFDKKFALENGKEIKLIFWDKAGQERLRSADLKAVRSANGIILVFDFTRRDSFEHLENWISTIKDNFNDDIIIVLFGNKIDLGEEYWQVTSKEAKEYAQQKNLVLFETSAKMKKGINEGFNYITNKAYSILEKRMEKKNNIIIKLEEKNNEKCIGKKKKNK